MFLTSNYFMQIHKDQKSPFLMSGCKVADGAGTMLVHPNSFLSFWCAYVCVRTRYHMSSVSPFERFQLIDMNPITRLMKAIVC